MNITTAETLQVAHQWLLACGTSSARLASSNVFIDNDQLRVTEPKFDLRIDEHGRPEIRDEEREPRAYGSMEVAVRHFRRIIESCYKNFGRLSDSDEESSSSAEASQSKFGFLRPDGSIQRTLILHSKMRLSQLAKCKNIEIRASDPYHLTCPVHLLYSGGGAEELQARFAEFVGHPVPDLADLTFDDLRFGAHQRGYGVEVSQHDRDKKLQYAILWAEALARPPKEQVMLDIARTLGTYVHVNPLFSGPWASVADGVHIGLAEDGLADVAIIQNEGEERKVRFGGYLVMTADSQPANLDERYDTLELRDSLAEVCTVHQRLPSSADALQDNVLQLARAGRTTQAGQTVQMALRLPVQEFERFVATFGQRLADAELDAVAFRHLSVRHQMVGGQRKNV